MPRDKEPPYYYYGMHMYNICGDELHSTHHINICGGYLGGGGGGGGGEG